MILPSYMYAYDKAVRLKSGDRQILLQKGDLFKFGEYKGYPSVVKDGVVYIVRADRVSELKRRSKRLKLTKPNAIHEAKFDVFGHEAAEALYRCAVPLTKSDPDSDFANGYAYAKFVKRLPKGEVTCFLKLNKHSASASVYSSFDLGDWDFLPRFNQAIRKAVKALKVQAKPFKVYTASFSNVKLPSGEPFSGKVYSYAANWSY